MLYITNHITFNNISFVLRLMPFTRETLAVRGDILL